jgi:hypothetical protein
MAEMYASEKGARSATAKRLAKVFVRRKAACDRVRAQSDNEPGNLSDLRNSLRITYIDLYTAILRTTARLVCALDDSSFDKKFMQKMQMTFGWSEWGEWWFVSRWNGKLTVV